MTVLFGSVAVMLAAVFAFCDRPKHRETHPVQGKAYRWHGPIFGTTFTIKIIPEDQKKTGWKHRERAFASLQKAVQKKLEEIDRSMSNWREDSELSRFNHYLSRRPFVVSPALFTVLKEAYMVYRLSQGAFDPARAELFSIWGFAPNGANDQFRTPSAARVQAALSLSGMHLLRLLPKTKQIAKRHPRLRIDLSAIAKGYSVDQLAALLHKNNIHSFMVEVGGEVRTGKRKPNGEAWRLAIERPHYDSKRSIFEIAYLENKAMATSGNYRNYLRDSTGKLYAHILDPRSGYPVTSPIAAATVIGPQCMLADALATSLMVLNLKQGKNLIARLPEYEALWLLTKGNEVYTSQLSSGMPAYLKKDTPSTK